MYVYSSSSRKRKEDAFECLIYVMFYAVFCEKNHISKNTADSLSLTGFSSKVTFDQEIEVMGSRLTASVVILNIITLLLEQQFYNF